jgi:hypothetical protein
VNQGLLLLDDGVLEFCGGDSSFFSFFLSDCRLALDEFDVLEVALGKISFNFCHLSLGLAVTHLPWASLDKRGRFL